MNSLYICGFSFYNIKIKHEKNYDTYLFDKKSYLCNCSNEFPCKKRSDSVLLSANHYVNKNNENNCLKMFKELYEKNKDFITIHKSIENIFYNS